MIDFKRRSYKKELLDRDDIPFEDICTNMQELEYINSKLGGHSITIKGFKRIAGDRNQLSVCEIGCGGGNNLLALKKWCARQNLTLHCTGIDINKDCIGYAKKNAAAADIEFLSSDFKNTVLSSPPDIIFCSLFTHHFAEKELVEILKWMDANATLGFYINDLHRHPLAYYLIKFLTSIFSRSYLVKNDAPLSVLRGFRKNEWKNILQSAGIMEYTINWKWAFRHLVVVQRTP
jgi:2-polyprenyl-3-methyl-5-hydroxy-6-metoxy-1,4-benzoquinol methylase